jgi:hypothetical protein
MAYSIRLLSEAVLLTSSLAAPLANAVRLPEPPIPPPKPPLGDAPVPHKDTTPPAVVENQNIHVTAENFRNQSKRSDAAAGYAPGSQYENSTEQKGIQTLGFLVRVPLE